MLGCCREVLFFAGGNDNADVFGLGITLLRSGGYGAVAGTRVLFPVGMTRQVQVVQVGLGVFVVPEHFVLAELGDGDRCKDTDNRDNDQEFDQTETSFTSGMSIF